MFQQLTLNDALAAKSSRVLKDPNPQRGRARRNDHATSIAGAADVAKRAGGQKAKLLSAYSNAPQGLNDEEAAERAGVPMRSCWWKRCGELRVLGLITELKDANGETVTRLSSANVPRIVCVITPLGIATHQQHNK